MQLEFIPVEAFLLCPYPGGSPFRDLENPDLVEQVRSRLEQECGQPSTIAAANKIHLTMYFAFMDTTTALHPSSLVSVADWQDNLRLSSDYGSWIRRKPVRTERFSQRSEFAQNCGHTSRLAASLNF